MKRRSEIVKCDYCNEEIRVNGWLLDNFKTHFCNKECADEYKRKKEPKGIDHPNSRSVKVECENCGEKILRNPSSLKGKHVFCNKQCEGEWKSKNILGDKHPSWRGGRKRLSEAIRNLIEGKAWTRGVFERDGFKCTNCYNVGNIHAHHIIGVYQLMTDYDIKSTEEAKQCKALYDLNNGVTLCRDCHEEFHSIYTKHKFTEENYYEWINNIKIAI